MNVSTVDARPVAVALYKDACWYNFKTSPLPLAVWDAAFNAANHLRELASDPTFPTLQSTALPDYAVISCHSMVMFSDGAPVSTVMLPPNLYFGPYPGIQSVH